VTAGGGTVVAGSVAAELLAGGLEIDGSVEFDPATVSAIPVALVVAAGSEPGTSSNTSPPELDSLDAEHAAKMRGATMSTANDLIPAVLQFDAP
jgi:hypothetical protein